MQLVLMNLCFISNFFIAELLLDFNKSFLEWYKPGGMHSFVRHVERQQVPSRTGFNS